MGGWREVGTDGQRHENRQTDRHAEINMKRHIRHAQAEADIYRNE